jgi:hypothetical protein
MLKTMASRVHLAARVSMLWNEVKRQRARRQKALPKKKGSAVVGDRVDKAVGAQNALQEGSFTFALIMPRLLKSDSCCIQVATPCLFACHLRAATKSATPLGLSWSASVLRNGTRLCFPD